MQATAKISTGEYPSRNVHQMHTKCAANARIPPSLSRHNKARGNRWRRNMQFIQHRLSQYAHTHDTHTQDMNTHPIRKHGPHTTSRPPGSLGGGMHGARPQQPPWSRCRKNQTRKAPWLAPTATQASAPHMRTMDGCLSETNYRQSTESRTQ